MCTFSLWLGVRASAVKMQEHLDEMDASRRDQFVVFVKRAGILVLGGLCFSFTKELSRERKPIFPFAFKFKSYILYMLPRKLTCHFI